jgi:hypothetical protein
MKGSFSHPVHFRIACSAKERAMNNFFLHARDTWLLFHAHHCHGAPSGRVTGAKSNMLLVAYNACGLVVTYIISFIFVQAAKTCTS